MLNVQVTKNNFEQHTLGKNDSTADKNFAIREELLNVVENKDATESDIVNLVRCMFVGAIFVKNALL